jgi:hypothetical protein
MAMRAAIAITRICPGCRRAPLRSVAGGLGKMGRCGGCGYTGPLLLEPDEAPDAPGVSESAAPID